jgi:hypothetical protein
VEVWYDGTQYFDFGNFTEIVDPPATGIDF